jgi:sporulation protein YabP
MELSGVNNVNTFDEEEIILETDLGFLYILGKELHINMLNLDEGKVALQGEINSLEYKAQGTDIKAKGKNILNRLLK